MANFYIVQNKQVREEIRHNVSDPEEIFVLSNLVATKKNWKFSEKGGDLPEWVTTFKNPNQIVVGWNHYGQLRFKVAFRTILKTPIIEYKLPNCGDIYDWKYFYKVTTKVVYQDKNGKPELFIREKKEIPITDKIATEFYQCGYKIYKSYDMLPKEKKLSYDSERNKMVETTIIPLYFFGKCYTSKTLAEKFPEEVYVKDEPDLRNFKGERYTDPETLSIQEFPVLSVSEVKKESGSLSYGVKDYYTYSEYQDIRYMRNGEEKEFRHIIKSVDDESYAD